MDDTRYEPDPDQCAFSCSSSDSYDSSESSFFVGLLVGALAIGALLLVSRSQNRENEQSTHRPPTKVIVQLPAHLLHESDTDPNTSQLVVQLPAQLL